ncbi:hypothetical protein [Parashewanella tropica]|uniref:hypothetical protein n=1 Tax=Parashewanella tropica TaxID=2547970 RepID=UPI00105A4CBF|nr:hypothetical protein [Parashewanella tropica]
MYRTIEINPAPEWNGSQFPLSALQLEQIKQGAPETTADVVEVGFVNNLTYSYVFRFTKVDEHQYDFHQVRVETPPKRSGLLSCCSSSEPKERLLVNKYSRGLKKQFKEYLAISTTESHPPIEDRYIPVTAEQFQSLAAYNRNSSEYYV